MKSPFRGRIFNDEEELSEAVQVNNKKSLHRYITILTENLTREDQNAREHAEFRDTFLRLEHRIDLGITEMKEGFKRMDERFEAVDKRFEAMQQQMDERFEAVQRQMDERFEAVQQQMDRRFDAVDKRFETVDKRFDDVNKRFSMMFTFITIGFVALATLMSVYQFL